MKNNLNEPQLSCVFNADDKTLNLAFESLDPQDFDDTLSDEEINECFVSTMGKVVDYIEEILPFNKTSFLIEQLLLIHASEILFAMKFANEDVEDEAIQEAIANTQYNKSMVEIIQLFNEEIGGAIEYCAQEAPEEEQEEDVVDISQEIADLKFTFKKMECTDLNEIKDAQRALFELGENASSIYIQLCEHFENTNISPLVAAWSFTMASMILSMLRQGCSSTEIDRATNAWQHYFSSAAHYVLGEDEDDDELDEEDTDEDEKN